ncbi:NAD(P)/FAD-dependent oxidoreductase [Daejeonella sp. JGW-45]|uniref:NAD(P)/FAD-dependent oxidoreductase n=1 Tax=Daejeonella sp. JGW-45 TaxID=3034148 RepID=UPI0023EB592F|nr:NAD(P)/FAD-dependent oxidoreductase [Daejeonella sp. JGW-45]
MNNNQDFDAIIIGGGACGLMCAVQAGFLGKKVLIIEKNEKVGAKILISGGGRCNYANLYATDANFISGNPHFCKSAFSQFSVEDTVSFFETYGIIGEEKTLGQLFPESNNAKDIVRIFEDLCREMGQEIICGAEVKYVAKDDNGTFSVSYKQDLKTKTAVSAKVVITTGGLPIPKMGATDFGLKVARQFGLNIIQTAPALVPLTITGKDAEWYTRLSGNSIYCRVSNHRISFEENILFTHWGLSGPAILQISSYWRPGEHIRIDLLPDSNINDLVQAARQTNGRKTFLSLLSETFTRKFADALAKFLPVEKNLASLTKEDIAAAEKLIHFFDVKPAGDKGYDRAEVMRGGVDTAELSSRTLEAKKVPGLYFGGECVDVTGWLGGYNFQWAWSSGYIMAQHL